MPKSSSEQRRVQSQNDFSSNTKLKSAARLSPTRVTIAQRPSIRSDTFLLANNGTVKNRSSQLPLLRLPVRSGSTPVNRTRVQLVHSNSDSQSLPKYVTSTGFQRKSEAQPVYMSQKRTNTLHPSGGPIYYRAPSPSSADVTERVQRVRVANDEVVVQRRARPPVYVYDEEPVEPAIESQRVVRVLRDAPRQEDDVYYVEPQLVRRKSVIRKAPPTEYIQVEQAPLTVRRQRPEIVYLDEQIQPTLAYDDDYMLVDETGREVSLLNQRNPTSHYAQYIYEDDRDRRVVREPQVVYIDGNDRRRAPETEVIYLEEKAEQRVIQPQVVYLQNEPSNDQVYYAVKHKQPPSTRIIYH